MDLNNMKEDYNWKEVFKYAGDYTFDDIEEIIASEDGENDGPDWLGVFKMKNGKILHVWAGCDYTGWGCQEGGDYAEFETLKDCLSPLGLPKEHRARLSLEILEHLIKQL